MNNEIIFEYSDEFDKNVKNYFKKYFSLKEDLRTYRELLINRYKEIKNIREIISKHINILYEKENIFVLKERLAVLCLSNKGKSFRVIYIYIKNKIIFIELYYKGDKENENKELYLEKINDLLE